MSPCVQVAASGWVLVCWSPFWWLPPRAGRHAALLNIHILSVFVNLRTEHEARGRDTGCQHTFSWWGEYSWLLLLSIWGCRELVFANPIQINCFSLSFINFWKLPKIEWFLHDYHKIRIIWSVYLYQPSINLCDSDQIILTGRSPGYRRRAEVHC